MIPFLFIIYYPLCIFINKTNTFFLIKKKSSQSSIKRQIWYKIVNPFFYSVIKKYSICKNSYYEVQKREKYRDSYNREKIESTVSIKSERERVEITGLDIYSIHVYLLVLYVGESMETDDCSRYIWLHGKCHFIWYNISYANRNEEK